MKNRDIAEGKVHNLIRGTYNKNSNKKDKEPEILVTQSGSLKQDQQKGSTKKKPAEIYLDQQ